MNKSSHSRFAAVLGERRGSARSDSDLLLILVHYELSGRAALQLRRYPRVPITDILPVALSYFKLPPVGKYALALSDSPRVPFPLRKDISFSFPADGSGRVDLTLFHPPEPQENRA